MGFLEALLKDLRENYAATLIIDAGEQRIERSADYEKQRNDYSGGKTTAKSFNGSSRKTN